MTQPEETPVSFIPPNFIEKGKILNGTFDIRNAIESIVLSLAIGIPVSHLPLSLTARIIILCMTALPAAMVALIGIGGESITAFLMNALRFVVNRRVIWGPTVFRKESHAGTHVPKSQRQRNTGKQKKRQSLPK